MGATVLTKSDSVDDREARIAARILNSGNRMNRLVSDMLDLTRTRLGAGIPITPKPMDLLRTCELVIAELEAIHPGRALRLQAKGELQGEWDGDRLTQMISNLVANALQHGGKDSPVSLVAEAHRETVVLRVHNEGPPIAAKAMGMLFEPMVRMPTEGDDRNPSGLGLGLYIAREIVTSHSGTVTVTSTKKHGTTFTVTIPRRPPVKAAEVAGPTPTKKPRAAAAPKKKRKASRGR